MAGEKQEAPWPIPKFHFSVTFEGIGEIAFQEVTGLDTQNDQIEYRASNNKIFSTVKMPGLKKTTDITLKKGLFKDDGKLMDYFQSIKMNIIKRETVVIKLLNESGEPVFSWKLTGAWPLQLTGPDLNAESNEVALETMVLAHEGITFQQGGG